MVRIRLLLASIFALVAVPALAADHLVMPAQLAERLAARQAVRTVDLGTVQAALSTAPAERLAGRVGVDLERVRAAAATLDDVELRDLARRARALQGDPVAGVSKDVNDLLVLFLIVAIVILVLQAVD